MRPGANIGRWFCDSSSETFRLRCASLYKVVLLFFSIAIHSSFCQAAAITKGDSEIALVDGSIHVLVKLQHKKNPVDCLGANALLWGSERVCPDSRISSIDIKDGESGVLIPYSAFADLTEPRSIQILKSAQKMRFSVKIMGGEAATSYTATLYFRNHSMIERVVRSNEFPDDAWERTTYKYNTK
jgi:hypothetical protein